MIPPSGQRRINAKRRERAAFWEARRTVQVLIGAEMIGYVHRLVKLLGDGARIHRFNAKAVEYVFDMDVHIPGAPLLAVRANPRIRSVWNGDHYDAELAGIDWLDANGRLLSTPTR